MPFIRVLLWPLLALLLLPGSLTAQTFDRRWEIHLIHHSHVDIGWSQDQGTVMWLHWQNLEKALDLIDATRDLPEEARFRWNPEVTWVIETWMQEAKVHQRDRFLQAVRDGSIGIDALYANLLSELCRPRELLAAFDYKNELEKLTDVQIDSAMISDVPGAPWGLVSALSQSGVRYLSWGPNSNTRIGFFLQDWADRPFYWTSPSGKDRVLVFIHGKGYYFFAGGQKFTPELIFPYLKELADQGYPYSILPIRYVLADNGLPDSEISMMVKEWNEKYPEVQVKLTTVSQSFRELEERYGDKIPSFSGDLTPYWSDGAASTARETAIARETSEKLGAYETILTQAQSGSFPARLFHEAWNQVLLFNEHTWGAWKSITEPDSTSAKMLWEWKRERAIKAADLTGEILAGTFAASFTGEVASIQVINPNSWKITGPVTVPGDGYGLPGARVETPDGRPVPSQVLSDGRILFIAEEVPGLSSKEYFVKSGAPFGSNGACTVKHNSIENDRLVLSWDLRTGKINGLKRKADGREYVNAKFRDSFNEYIYVGGRNPRTDRKKAGWMARIALKEAGPLVCTVEISQKVPGSNLLATTITMYAGMERIDLVNTLDRPVVRTPEGIYFAFPVAAINPVVRYDTAWGSVEVDRDQLMGSCKNYLTPLRWVDVSGEDGGLMIVLVDAPLFEAGAITTDATNYGWQRQTEHNGVVYSYVMNNYWEANYKADQPGVTSFRYSLFPHGAYDTPSNMKNSLEVMRPLFATGTPGSFSIPAPSILIDNDNIIVDSIRPYTGVGREIDLYNLSDHEEEMRIESPGCSELLRLESGRQFTPLPDSSLVMGRHEFVRLVCRETDPEPVKATLVSPLSITSATNWPSFTWNVASKASWYWLWVNDSTGNRVSTWYSAARSCSDKVCTASPSTTLAQGVATWWVQTWNPGGYGPWSDAGTFMVPAPVFPGKATLVSPCASSSTSNPAYTWNADANAIWYWLWVNDSTGNKINQWYSALQAGCGSGTGTCSVSPGITLAEGPCKWWVETWNPNGLSPWSDPMAFTVGAASGLRACP